MEIDKWGKVGDDDKYQRQLVVRRLTKHSVT